jgi:AbrB family looped-hinge helix DNA binding protein
LSVKPHIARVDRSGRLVLPAVVRSHLELRDGDELVVITDAQEREVRLIPRRAAVRRAQEIVRQNLTPGPSLVDALIAERRAEARKQEKPATTRHRR